MQYRELKKLGVKLSVLSFGAMRLPHKNLLPGPGIDEKKVIRLIRRGIELGINYIDTAYFYHFGASEKAIGASKPERINRQEPNGAASLCVKCGACIPKCPQGIQIPTELENLVMNKKRKITEIYN